ncbi:aminopeptidase m1 [Quercus suber]|uniref:Aminopeptidase n=1 Tax=Quercus suber TaxID=58331 RepID=A0AAW0KQ68_QUESU
MSYIKGIGCGLLLALASYFYIRSRRRPNSNMTMEEFKGQPRLPKFAVPKRYDIRLKLNLTTCKFAGSVAIELKIVADTSFIVLNATELSIDTTSVSFTHPDAHSSNSKQQATFKITLDVPSQLVALSNMPIIEEKVVGDLKTVSYQESPTMSTYLVAIVVGLFDYVEHLTSDGVKVRVYCQIGKVNQGKFALDVAVRTLELYNEYFAVPYSLPKLDMVAIPDFSFGSMENYGLVTYCETNLLYDVRHSTADDKQRVSYLAADLLFPEWKVCTQFLDDYTKGLGMDGLRESHPIEVMINHASEIDEIIDSISYIKGASVIRMLQSYLGDDCFQRSLASYVKKFACSDAKTEDLWAALEKESGEPVNKLMNSWTKQKGYPVVSVKVKDQKLVFEQSQFLASGSHGDGQWIVPITLCCGSYDARKNFLLQTNSETLDMKELISDESNLASAWVKLNVDQTGFYRVEYDEDLEDRLRNAIKKKYLSATDRSGILDDSFALCMACQKSFTSFLQLLNAYKQELEYTVLSNLIKISYKVDRITADAAPGSSVASFFIELFLHSAMKLGWEPKTGESHLDAMLRGEVLTALAMFGHDLTLKEASRRFFAFLDDRNTPLLHPNIRKAVYVAVMRRVSTSNRFGYESLLRVYRETNLSQEKAHILSSLTSSPDPNITLEALNFLLSSEVRTQDAVLGLAVSREGRETAWSWLKVIPQLQLSLSLYTFPDPLTLPGASVESSPLALITGVKVRVYCQVGKVNQGKFTLDVAVRTLELYKEYLAVPYSLPNLDMVAILDFAFGSMENCGLVTYCEIALLYDVQHSTAADK